MGEPLNKFIQRVRLEKAAYALIDNPKKSATEIALDFGFSGSSSFARAFKEHFRPVKDSPLYAFSVLLLGLTLWKDVIARGFCLLLRTAYCPW